MLTEVGIFLVIALAILVLLYMYNTRLQSEAIERHINCLEEEFKAFLAKNEYYKKQIDEAIPEKQKDAAINIRIIKDQLQKMDQALRRQQIYSLSTRIKQLENKQYRSKL